MPTTAPAAPPVLEPLRDTGSRAAARVFCVLAAIADLGPGPHPLAEITARLGGVPRSVVARVLASGVDAGFITREAWGSYELSPRARMLEMAAPHPALPAGATAALAALHEATGALVHLHGLWSLGAHHYACVAAEPGRRPELAGLLAAHDPAIDAPRSVRLGAAGHAMIPWMAGDHADQVLAVRAPATRTAVFREPLREHPELIRQRGYAVCRAREGFTTFAAPILSGDAATGALALTVRSASAERASGALARHLTTHAAYLQAVLADPASAPAA